MSYFYALHTAHSAYWHYPSSGLLCAVIFFFTGSTPSLSSSPNTVVTYTCTITNGTAAGLTDWALPNGTCPTNAFPDKIRLSQFVSGQCSAQVTSTCGPYAAYSIQSSDPTYCLSSILNVTITAAMNGSTVTCYNTNYLNSSITGVVFSTTINIVGMSLSVV